MTSLPPPISGLLEQVARQVRARRAESGALRGVFWGGLIAAILLLAKGGYEEFALPVALGAWALCIAAGALLGASRRPPRLEVARIADQAFGLHDRVSTSIEYSLLERNEPLAEAQLADTVARLAALSPRNIVPRHTPREMRYVALPVIAFAVLAIAPPLPGADSWLPEALGGKAPRDPYVSASREERARLFGWDMKQRDALSKQEALQPVTAEKQRVAEDASDFKDKSTNKPKMDFASFVQKGDDRLKMLERADKLPDLQSDFASSKYRMMLQKTQELSAGKGGQISPRRLEQILREMQRMGKKGGDFDDEINEGLEALEGGQTEEAMNSMQTALAKLRIQEERERNSRRIAGVRDRNQEDSEDGGSRGSSAANSMDRMGYSSGGPKGSSSSGKATPRLRSTPYDAAIDGQRRGRMPSVETQQITRPQSIAAQLQVMGDMIQYRRAMEDAITREQVPRDYHDQIRDYFKSLQE